MIFIPSHIDYAVIDVETSELEDGYIPETKFWGYADSKGYKRFETSKKLEKFLNKIPPKVLLHHANFDVTQLIVDGCHEDLEFIKTHNGKFILTRKAHHSLQNTLAIFPESLKKIFKAFGYTKSSLKDLAKRNYEDCVNGLDCFLQLNDIIHKLVDVYPLEVGTVAGTTFRAAEKTVGKMPKDLRFLDAYRGGRVEVFSGVECEASAYDIHSSYPRSFLEVENVETLLHVQVTSQDWLAPLFDERVRDMLLFPNGSFPSWVFQSNYERYIKPHAPKTKIKVLEKFKLDTIWLSKLQSLVLKLYNLKMSSGESAVATCAKYLLNAFYGRIGLKGESERCRILTEPQDNGDETKNFYLGKKRWLVFDTVTRETRSNYGYAAFITDNARGRLFDAFAKNTPLYGDTDSLFTRQTSFVGNIGATCGEWECKGRKKFKATNVKDYEFGGELVVKGGQPGKPKLIWTLKRFCSGKGVMSLIRHRRQGLRKRLLLPDGSTEPHTVN